MQWQLQTFSNIFQGLDFYLVEVQCRCGNWKRGFKYCKKRNCCFEDPISFCHIPAQFLLVQLPIFSGLVSVIPQEWTAFGSAVRPLCQDGCDISSLEGEDSWLVGMDPCRKWRSLKMFSWHCNYQFWDMSGCSPYIQERSRTELGGSSQKWPHLPVIPAIETHLCIHDFRKR